MRGCLKVIRRLQIRRQNTLLLVVMRISYGGTILALLAANATTLAAANLDALDAVHIAYTLPDAGDTGGDTGDVAPS